jgi:hypothetical protein
MKPADWRGIRQFLPQFREKTFVLALDGGFGVARWSLAV